MNTTDYDEEEDLYNHPAIAAFFVLTSLQGTLGNVLIIVAVARDRRLRTDTDMFLLNVAVMDLLVTSVIMPSMVPLILAERNVYPHVVCQVGCCLMAMWSCDFYDEMIM